MKKNYAAIDIAKFIMGILVVAIHVNPFGDTHSGLRFPITRVAVPMFFLLSSFLFFGKISNIESWAQKKQQLFKFCRRNLQLYFTWFILLLPITVYVRGYAKLGFFEFLKTFLMHFFLRSTFPSSWFIMALVLGTLFVFYAGRVIGNMGVFSVGLFLNVLCCVASNYRNILDESNILLRLVMLYPENIYQSFPVCIIWIAYGKLMAEKIQWINTKTRMWKVTGSMVGFILLFTEHAAIQSITAPVATDSYFSFWILCPFLCSVIIDADWKGNQITKVLRSISIVMYCSHRAFEEVYSFIFRRIDFDITSFAGAITLFMLVIISSIMLGLIIEKLKHYSYFKWLRFCQ